MKKILKILVTLVILGAVGGFLYHYQDIIRAGVSPIVTKVITDIGIVGGPCENPITYTLGTFDSKFGITQTYFLSALLDAEAIWEKPFGKELFVYSEDNSKKGTVKINLVYDFRQEATSKLAGLGIVVSNNRATYDELKIKFTELKSKFATAKGDYDARVLSFNEEEKIYGRQVEYWNTRGGAPREEYDKLQREKAELDSKLSSLHASETQLTGMVDDINAVVVVLNRLANTLNISVDNYNTIGATRGESFEEGFYTSDGVNNEIDIYEFGSRAKLVRVLAHELGHALDLDHVEDPKAIMYKLNQGNSETLTAADLSALKTKCGE